MSNPLERRGNPTISQKVSQSELKINKLPSVKNTDEQDNNY